MKRGSTLLLRAVVVLIGLIIIALGVLLAPAVFKEDDIEFMIILGVLYASAVPFLMSLIQAMKLLNYIDANRTFSNASVQALKTIKYCALAFSGLYVLAMPAIFYVAETDDAPGVAALGFVLIFAAFVIATAAGVLQKLLQNAIDIKTENDLTV